MAITVALGSKLVLASCALALDLGPGASAGLSGSGFRRQGVRWPLGLGLQAPGPAPASRAVALGFGADARLPGCDCGFSPWL